MSATKVHKGDEVGHPLNKLKKCPKCDISMRITKDEIKNHTDGINTDYEYIEYICPICSSRDMQLIVFINET